MSGINENNLHELNAMFEQYEAPYSADEMQADWQQVSSKITSLPQSVNTPTGGGGASSFLSSIGFKAIIGLSAVAAISGVLYFNIYNWGVEENSNPSKNPDNITAESENVAAKANNEMDFAKENTAEYADIDNNKEKEIKSKPKAKHRDLKPINNPTKDDKTSKDQNNGGIDNNSDKTNKGGTTLLKASAKISNTQICRQECITIKLTNQQADHLYIFKMIDNKNGKVYNQGSIGNSRNIKMAMAGSFQLLVTEIADNKSRELLNEPIVVWEKPTARMDYEKNICNQFSFESKSINATEFTWLMPDNILVGKKVDYDFASEALEKVTLIVNNQYCADTVTKEIFVNAAITNRLNLNIVNIFTPNGDGTNDFFEIMSENPQLTDKTGTIEVYNYQNDLVFKSTSGLSDAWNGKLMNVGADCAPGYYTYIISYENTCDPTKNDFVKGVISIKR